MVNRPRQKGTAAETLAVGYLRDHGWPHAERRSLHGSLDRGDVTGTPGVAWEVKVGHAASGMPLSSWMTQTAVERLNARADFGVLVVKPRRYGPKSIASWLAFMYEPDLAALVQRIDGVTLRRAEVRTQDAVLPTLYAPTMYDDPLVVAVQRPLSKPAYMAMPFGLAVDLLRLAGYGDPLTPATGSATLPTYTGNADESEEA